MKKAILIAEKPSLMREIQSAYNEKRNEIPIEIDFLSQAGHLVGLKQPDELNPEYKKWRLEDLPLNLPYRYHVLSGKTELITKIKTAVNSGKYDFVIHAGDPDGEGELLVNLVLLYVGNKLPVKRFWSNDITHPAIIERLKNLEDDSKYRPFFDAALIRQHIDYQFGMNITRAASIKTGVTCQLGRVKAALIRMVVDRERAIRDFVEKTTWKRIFIYQNCEFLNAQEFESLEDAMNHLPKMNQALVTEVKDEQKSVKAPKLFKISTLQVEAYKRLGFSSSTTSSVLQNLYEAGAVSYPRTDCDYISSNVDLDDILSKVAHYPECDIRTMLERVPEIKKDNQYVNDKAIAKEGHTAIIPTGQRCPFGPDSRERKLYDLVTRRFCAIFMPNKIVRNISVTAEAEGELYKYKETLDVNAGYEFVLAPDYKEKKPNTVTFSKNQMLCPVEFKTKECTTKPPVRYNEGSIIQAMDKPEEYRDDENKKVVYSIGTPATRANIIQECINDNYFIIEKKQFFPTAKAETVIDNLGDLKLFDVQTSGMWEAMFEAVRTGKVNASEVENALMKECIDTTNDIKNRTLQKLSFNTEQLGSCPACGQPVLKGKFGPYCQAKCGMILGKYYAKDLSDSQMKSLLAGKKTLIKGLKSKVGSTYDIYLIPNGVEEFSYTTKDGTVKTGKQMKYETEFPKKGRK